MTKVKEQIERSKPNVEPLRRQKPFPDRNLGKPILSKPPRVKPNQQQLND
jgi:hypothetical protein